MSFVRLKYGLNDKIGKENESGRQGSEVEISREHIYPIHSALDY